MKKLSDNIRRVGVLANRDKPAARHALRRAVALIRDNGRDVLTEPGTARLVGMDLPVCDDDAELAAACELLLVFGGDGTMLRAARNTAAAATPILGVNLGTMGFLTACNARDLKHALELVWAGGCPVESRWLIQALKKGQPPRRRQQALNDFVISRGTVPRLIELEVRVNGELLTSYRGDGLIVSSPTGSTAYSLAAGGAVVSPRAEVFALTPVCPHTLSSRSVIVNLDSVVEVKLLSARVDTFLTADGQMPQALATGDIICFRRSRHAAHFVRLPGSSFFETLRRKLNWSGSSL